MEIINKEKGFKYSGFYRHIIHPIGRFFSRHGLPIYVGLIIAIFYIPIISVMIFSFNASNSATTWGGFSVKWYRALWESSALMEDLWITVSIAFLATLISTLIGTLGAIGLAEFNKKNKHFVNFVLSVNNLPVVNPDIVTAVSLMALFLALKDVLPMGYITMLLAHIAFCTPYVVIQVYPKVLALDPAEEEAAMDLGATRRQALLKVIIPDLMPAILSGAMLAFTMSFDDFIISYFVGGNCQNISIYVYSMKKFEPVVNALSTIIFLVIGVTLTVVEVIRFNKEKKSDEDKKISKKRQKIELNSTVAN